MYPPARPPLGVFSNTAFALASTLLLAGCDAQPSAQNSPPADAPPDSSAAKAPRATPIPLAQLAAGPAELWKEFSGARAFEEVRQQVELGPRHSGSETLEKARVLITTALEQSGWEVERQSFTDETPRGPISFVNLIGRFRPPSYAKAPAASQRAIVCSHYDTKRFSTIQFVGACDGGSSTGALLELARVLALAPALAVQVELVFFDGEEAIVQFDDKDGLYGSRYYARQLNAAGRAAQFKFGILWDMIGDKDFNITLSPDSPAELTKEILSDAEALQLRGKFGYHDRTILDDHVPLNRIARIPTIDLIDFDYLYWHTADDTLARIGPDGLQYVGAVTLYHLRRALK